MNYLIYLDDMIVFSKTEGEYLQCLHIVFEHFREHNLKHKPTKCEFFKNKINYLAHHVSKEGACPNKDNLKTVAEFAPPQTYNAIWVFWGLVGHYQQFFKGFTCLMQPLSGEGSGKKSKYVTLTEDMLGAFKMLKKDCLEAPVLALCWLQ